MNIKARAKKLKSNIPTVFLALKDKIEVPVYFFEGRYDINAPVELAIEYYDLLDCPEKELVWFEHSGHSPWMNESDKFAEQVIRVLKK